MRKMLDRIRIMIKLEDYGISMWDDNKIKAFRESLLDWYDREKRDLPWRHSTNPYHIWISEIMLQQTQVVTVIPYYLRFLDTFPTIKDLAEAEEEQLLKAWEGLGYYSRVRNMQKAAQQIQEEHQGIFPNTMDEIKKLKGIGPYTAGAIASIAFNLPEPAVDGNVMRVMARLFEVDYDIGVPANRKIFQAIMEYLIDPNRPGDFNQALMDLGSDIESPKSPHPQDGPVWSFSAAYLNGTMDKYPIKEPKKKPRPVNIQAALIINEFGEILLEKNTEQGLLSGFWSSPLLETSKQSDLTSTLEEKYATTFTWENLKYPQVKHIFSHRKWQINMNLSFVNKDSISENDNLIWLAEKDFQDYPLSTPQLKLWETYKK